MLPAKSVCDWKVSAQQRFITALMSGLGRIAFVHKKYADAER
jgi:hypothetical protein